MVDPRCLHCRLDFRHEFHRADPLRQRRGNLATDGPAEVRVAVEGDSPIGLQTDLEAAHEENQHINYDLHAASLFFPPGFRNVFHTRLHLSVLAIRLVRLHFPSSCDFSIPPYPFSR